MPISTEDLMETGTEVTVVQNRKAQDSVLGLLTKHKKQAFTQREIADELGMKPQQARQCCVALAKKNVVIRKQVEIPVKDGTENRSFWTLKQ